MRVLLTVAAVAAVVTVGLVMTGVPADAHHASAPFYDQDNPVETEGVVTRFLFRNPHSFVYVDATDENGETVHWEVEMGTAISMKRRGWTPETIKPGDEIRVVGAPSRNPGTYGMCCAELSNPDGSPIRP